VVIRPLAAGVRPPIPGIGRREAARLAREELSKPVYHPRDSLTYRILHAVSDWLSRLFQSASKLPGGWWSLVALAALAVVVVAVVLAWAGPVVRSRRRPRELAAGGPGRGARDHRDAAGRFAEAGDYGAAICETVRAIAADLDERGVLLPRAGRTADEFAAEAGQAIPDQAPGLREAALLFDEIRYGQRPGNQAGYRRVRELDGAVSAAAGRAGRATATPVPAGSGGRAP
jgi:uncharacterized protein DUF4129